MSDSNLLSEEASAILLAAMPHYLEIRSEAQAAAKQFGYPVVTYIDRYTADEFCDHPFHYCPETALRILSRHGTVIETFQP